MKSGTSDTKGELLRAALTCFATYGFDGASMRMIADRAKRPISLFPHYFGNKEGLYVAVFTWIMEDFLPASPPASDPGRPPRDRAEAVRRLREQVHHIYVESSPFLHTNDPAFEEACQLVLQEVRAPRPCLHELLRRHFAPGNQTIRLCLRTLRPDLDEETIEFIGISIGALVAGHGLTYGLNQVIWNQSKPLDSPFQASEILLELFLHGLLGIRQPL